MRVMRHAHLRFPVPAECHFGSPGREGGGAGAGSPTVLYPPPPRNLTARPDCPRGRRGRSTTPGMRPCLPAADRSTTTWDRDVRRHNVGRRDGTCRGSFIRRTSQRHRGRLVTGRGPTLCAHGVAYERRTPQASTESGGHRVPRASHNFEKKYLDVGLAEKVRNHPTEVLPSFPVTAAMLRRPHKCRYDRFQIT